MNIFERASRAKIRFNSSKGQLITEDLWSLSLTNLDTIAKSVNRELKNETEESFIETKSKTTTDLELKLDILKHIISSKQAQELAAKQAVETRARKERIEQLILEKSDEELKGKSGEELNAMITN